MAVRPKTPRQALAHVDHLLSAAQQEIGEQLASVEIKRDKRLAYNIADEAFVAIEKIRRRMRDRIGRLR